MKSYSFAGKHIIVTGAKGGIGTGLLTNGLLLDVKKADQLLDACHYLYGI